MMRQGDYITDYEVKLGPRLLRFSAGAMSLPVRS
jgi:hypothetical protein